MTTVVDWLSRQHAALLFLIILAGTTVVALACAWGAERLFDDDSRGRTSGTVTAAVGVVAAVYAVLVAFVIVNEWAAFSAAQAKASDESAALASVYASASVLPPPGSGEIQRAVLAYDRTLVCTEIPRLATHDGPSAASVAALYKLYGTVAAHPSDSAFYGNVVSGLNDVVSARRGRINSAVAALPDLLLVVITVTSVGLLAVVAALDTKHKRWHYAITGAMAVIIALNLTLVISLDRPFAGAAKVSDSPYREGIPAAVLKCSTGAGA